MHSVRLLLPLPVLALACTPLFAAQDATPSPASASSSTQFSSARPSGSADTSNHAARSAGISVNALVAEVLQGNPELAFYEAEIAVAKASLRAAGSREQPSLSLSVGRKRANDSFGTLSGEGNVWSVSVSQTFDWPGRLALRKAVANHDVALAELGLARFKAALAGRARTLAQGLYAAQERAEATAEVAARYRALREVFVARDPGGITPALEVRVIEAQELTLQRRATEASLALQSALLELNQLRGLPLQTPVVIAEAPLSFIPAPVAEQALAAARENHFAYRAALIELEQQGSLVSLARAETRPGLTVSPYFTQEKAGERERTVGVGFSVPLPVGGRANAGVAAAEARRRQSDAAAQVARRDMERELALAQRRFEAKCGEIAQWAPDATTRFREAADLADRHYRLGSVPLATYVELQSAYLEAVDALCSTQLEALEAAVQLQLMTGIDCVAASVAGEVRP